MGNLFSYPDSRIVETKCGKIQGRRLIYQGDKQVDAFQGIPFAKPPVGELRFKRGAPSEDCLYLNVFAPCWEAPEGGFPVMVFIHGGAFELGDAIFYGDIGICENIVTRDVIFVTIQYRLGYLGFMTTGDSTCPGNNGLWDQVAALRWVNENIEAFGGNKNNITLLGQSAGGASTDMLHLSPHSTHLFHKVIPMAGNAECRWAYNQKMPQQCRKKAARLGITEYGSSQEMLEKRRTASADKFAVNFLKRDKEPDVDFETGPTLDGDFFPESIEELRKKATPKPMMTGVTKEEGIFLIMRKKATVEDMNWVLNLAVHDAKDKEKILEDLKALSFPDGIPEDKAQFMRKIANVASDYYINAGTLEMCRKTVANQEEPVYLYNFEHFNPRVLGFLRKLMPMEDATHGCELVYLFKKAMWHSQATTSTNPNGAANDKSDLPTYWKPLDKENHSRNYVFTSDQPYMDETFFDGRPEKFTKIVETHRA